MKAIKDFGFMSDKMYKELGLPVPNLKDRQPEKILLRSTEKEIQRCLENPPEDVMMRTYVSFACTLLDNKVHPMAVDKCLFADVGFYLRDLLKWNKLTHKQRKTLRDATYAASIEGMSKSIFAVEDFNLKYRVGATLAVATGRKAIKTKVLHPARVKNGVPMAWFEGFYHAVPLEKVMYGLYEVWPASN